MSTLQVANVWFESTAAQRIDRVGTTINIVSPSVNVSSNLVVAGTLTQSEGVNYPIVMGSNTATTSGTSKDFTGIPSWVKRITIMLNGVSTSGTSVPLIQIGTGGSPTTSGYLGSGSYASATITSAAYTTGFGLVGGAITAGVTLSGNIVISNIDGNVWIASYTGAYTSAATTWYGSGNVTLAGVLDMVRITTVNGSDTFDAGFVNIMYE